MPTWPRRRARNTPSGSGRVTIERERPEPARGAYRRLWPAFALLAFLALAIVLAWPPGWFHRREAAPRPTTAAATLAIFPFRSLPDSADGQLLELGLADVLISRLNQLPEIRVLPLSATERVRSTDPREAGEKLGADRVLTGTLQRDDDRVRASVQLLSISEGRAIWSATFDAQAASAFSIQDAVVARVLQEVAPQLSPSAARRLVEPGTRNGEAYESYLRGRADAAPVTGAAFFRAAESFRRAVTLDPGYADAWAALGAVCRRLPIVRRCSVAGRVHRSDARGEASARARTGPRGGAVGAGGGRVLVRVGLPAGRRADAAGRRTAAELRGVARAPRTSPVESRPPRRSARGDSPCARPGSEPADRAIARGPVSRHGAPVRRSARGPGLHGGVGAEVRTGARDARLSAGGPGRLRRGDSRIGHRHRARSRHRSLRRGWPT